MRALSHFPLHDVIIFNILVHLSDFPTLRSAILSCKSIHNVYRTYSNSIRLAVIHNVAGPAYEIAMLLARVFQGQQEDLKNDLLIFLRDIKQVKRLRNNAEAVSKLEDLFSLR